MCSCVAHVYTHLWKLGDQCQLLFRYCPLYIDLATESARLTGQLTNEHQGSTSPGVGLQVNAAMTGFLYTDSGGLNSGCHLRVAGLYPLSSCLNPVGLIL